MNCPFCRQYFGKKSLAVEHIEKMHGDRLEADGLDASQELYLMTHPSLHGKCMCGCSTPTEWNYKTGKPYKVSPDPKCRERIYQIAQARSVNATGHDQHTLMHDAERQKKMLSNRRITGQYKFADGNTVEYTGKLEMAFLQFCDKVLDLPSYAIQGAPETFTYHDPKTDTDRMYIPDYYLPDYNLIVEIKDGGTKTNGNKAFIEETKYKVALKDAAMKAQNKYNYIRISGNNFGPFLEALYQIVHEREPDEKKRKALVVITEAACMDAADSTEAVTVVNEEIDPDKVHLIVGYIEGTHLPKYVAISDSILGSYWYISVYETQMLLKVTPEDAIFRDGGYRIFKCIANKEAISNVFKIIVTQCENVKTEREDFYKQWDIIDILGSYNIMFDDMLGNSNNKLHRSDWIMTEQYFMEPTSEGDDE